MTIRISVYITSYNQKEFLREAIESVIKQSLSPIEIIIIDDASTDGSVELIKQYSDASKGWIRPIFNSSNRGVSYCRIKAIEATNGDYVTWVDGDDCFLPNKLEIEASLLRGGKFQVAFSNFFLAQESLSRLASIWACDLQGIPLPGDMFKEVMSRTFPKNMLFRSELVEKASLIKSGLHDTKLRIYEDFDLRIRLAKTCKINYTLQPLSIYRLNSNGLSHRDVRVHYESLLYIFNKNRHLLSDLTASDKAAVEEKITLIMDGLSLGKGREFRRFRNWIRKGLSYCSLKL